MYKKIAIMILICALIIPFTACEKNVANIFTGGDEDGITYEESENVNFAISSIETLNPVISTDEDTYWISKLIYQGIFSLDENLIPQMDLASKYTINSENNSVSIVIDRRARFSNGKRVTGEDIKFSVDCYKQAGRECIYENNVSCISSVDVESKNEVTIHFNEKGDMSNLIFPILPKHKYGDPSQVIASKEDFKPIGSGKYKVKSYNKTKRLMLVPNKEYRGERAENNLLFNVYYKNADILNLTDGNLVSFSVIRDIDRQTKIGSKDLKTVEFTSNEVEFVGFKCDSEIFKDVNMRKAVACAINPKTIITNAYSGSGIVNDSLYFPGYFGDKNTGDMYKYDVKKAKEYLKKTEYSDTNKDGYIEDENGKEIVVRIIVNSDKCRVKAADIIENYLHKVGISTEVVSTSQAQYEASLKGGKFDLYIGGARISEEYDLSTFVGEGNIVNYVNEDAISLTDKLNKPQEEEEKLNDIHSLKKILKDEVPYYPLMYKTYSAVVSNELQGEIKPMFFDYYHNCSKWYSEYMVKTKEESEL